MGILHSYGARIVGMVVMFHAFYLGSKEVMYVRYQIVIVDVPSRLNSNKNLYRYRDVNCKIFFFLFL